MKLIFYAYVLNGHPGSGKASTLMKAATAESIGNESEYSKYLCAVLHFEFQDARYCEEVLIEIRKLEQGEIEKTGWAANAFITDIYSDRVEIDHQQFGGLPEWPMWTCSLQEFKVALEEWKNFLEMPVDASTQVIVELPDSTSNWK